VLHERLFVALAKAHLQLKKMREEGDPLYIQRVYGIDGRVKFYADRNKADIKIDRSKEISFFRKKTQKDLIYILADESLWSEHKKLFSDDVELEDQLWWSKRDEKESVELAYSYERDSQYVFDERHRIVSSDSQAAEKSIITRAIYLMDGLNPYENNYQLKDEYFFKSIIRKANFELDKLISSFESWLLKISFSYDKNKYNHLSSSKHEDEFSQAPTLLIAAVKETLEIFRDAKNIINYLYPIWLFKAGYIELNNGEIGGIEKAKLVSIWGKSIKAFDNEISKKNKAIKAEKEIGVSETKQIIRIEKKALDLNTLITQEKICFRKLIEINSAINFLESKHIRCNLEINNFEERAEEITYLPFEIRLNAGGNRSMSNAKQLKDSSIYNWFTKKINVIGLGRAGRIMMELLEPAMEFPRFIYADTDFNDLDKLSNFYDLRVIKLGHNYTKGQGAHGNPEVGNAVVKKNSLLFKNSLPRGSTCAFILAGLGGGTGSGGASEVVKIGRESGIFTIAILTEPKDINPKSGETAVAKRSIQEINKEADGVILIPNEELEEHRKLVYEPLMGQNTTKAGIAVETLTRLLSNHNKAWIKALKVPGIPIPPSDIKSFFSGNNIVRLGSSKGHMGNLQSVTSQARDNLGFNLRLAKKILVCMSSIQLDPCSNAEDNIDTFRDWINRVEDIIKMGCRGGVKIITGFDNFAYNSPNAKFPYTDKSKEQRERIMMSEDITVTIFASFSETAETTSSFNEFDEKTPDLENKKEKELVRV